MAFDQGIDFRSTAGFVTDPANCDVETATAANYPRTSAQGNHVGWEDAISGVRNRSAAVDARLAGIAFLTATTAGARYRIDLPASGWYRVTLAIGDATTNQIGSSVEVLDGTTAVSNVFLGGSQQALSAGAFVDACNEYRTSAADWVANEVSFVAFFSSGICRVRIGRLGTSNSTPIAHIRVQAASAPSPSFNAGINFRNTSKFVADPTNTSNDISTVAADYPHITAQGLTVGWEQTPSGGGHDRSAAVDARLAGVTACSAGTQSNFRIDLPAAGAYRISLAIGDASVNQDHSAQQVEIFDDASSLGNVVTAASTSAGQFYDATGVLRTSAADWVTNQAEVTARFATTILRLKCGITGTSTTATTLAHVRVTQLEGLVGTSSLSAIIKKFHRFVATLAGVGHLAASITGIRRFTATLAGVGHLAASITGIRRFTATLAGKGSLTATVSTGRTVKNITVGLAGTSSLRAALPYRVPSGSVTLQGDAPTVYPYYTISDGAINLAADNPTQTGTTKVPAGALVLVADAPALPAAYQPQTGVITLRGDAPTLVTSFKPAAGKTILAADVPTVYPFQTPTGKVAVKGDAPSSVPTAAVSGRIVMRADGPVAFPIVVEAAGIIRLFADAPAVRKTSIVLENSGIIRLRADVPIVTPLTEPPPPPPPGTGISAVVTV